MQLTLAFLEPSTPTPPTLTPSAPSPSTPSRELHNAEARAEARNILARIIAQAVATPNQTEASDE
jgi:hypothetical protein